MALKTNNSQEIKEDNINKNNFPLMYFEEKFGRAGVINSASVILILLQSGKVSFVQHFLSFQGTHEIKFMFRKINISKKKQFYQEIPIENMRYLNKKRKSQLSSNKSTYTETAF